ncbi:hypothetical protein EJB05_57711 [Eragrostis curvula]|uniref:Uncharacterized protein n=1 Tax=Eragrostis curvula TaxID=38414 RepID=A0A5J9SDX5_9POAL|nr:hypothetical protein EJB05_57711 [Eragrostis curvula]
MAMHDGSCHDSLGGSAGDGECVGAIQPRQSAVYSQLVFIHQGSKVQQSKHMRMADSKMEALTMCWIGCQVLTPCVQISFSK